MICQTCKENKQHYAKDLCVVCYGKKRNLEHKEEIKIYNKQYHKEDYLRNKAEILKRVKKYNLEHKEEKKRCDKEYHIKNGDKKRATACAYYAERKDKDWFKKKEGEKQRKYRKTINGKLVNRRQKLERRSGYSAEAIKQVVKDNILKYGMICCEKCKCKCENNFHIDHIIPISKSGNNSYDNLQVLCAKHNFEKHMDIIDYRT